MGELPWFSLNTGSFHPSRWRRLDAKPMGQTEPSSVEIPRLAHDTGVHEGHEPVTTAPVQKQQSTRDPRDGLQEARRVRLR